MGAIVFNYIFFSKIWGSNRLKNDLKLTNLDNVGEMWTLSSINDKQTIALNGEYKGKSLSELYKDKNLFGDNNVDEFPLLVKIITTSDNLSVQVHPDDEYALKMENCSGKTEGWFILDCDEDSKIVIGHNAKSHSDFVKYLNENDFKSLLNYKQVKNGEFYPIPSGTVHAIGKNIMILEIQQSSDITYRLYDYDRVDNQGNKRELHIDKALNVINYGKYLENVNNYLFYDSLKPIWDNQFFSVYVEKIVGEKYIQSNEKYLTCCVVSGQLEVEEIKLVEGQSFIIPINQTTTIIGNGVVATVISKL